MAKSLLQLLHDAQSTKNQASQHRFVEGCYHHYRSDLWKEANRCLSNKQACEDALQALSLKLMLANLGKIQAGTERQLRAYLLRMLRNHCLDEQKSYRKRLVSSLEEHPRDPIGSDARQLEQRLDVQRILESIKDPVDRLIIRDLLAGYSHQEIAKRHQLGGRAVPSRIHRLRKRLRQQDLLN